MTRHYYLLPQFCFYGKTWEMNFWDALFYLAARRGLPMQITARAMATIMNGGPVSAQRYETARHYFMDSWRQAETTGLLIECTPVEQKAEKGNTGTLRLTYRGPKRIYCFDLPGYSPQKTLNYLHKPCGYIENGWISACSSVYTARLLNFALHHFQNLPQNAVVTVDELRPTFVTTMKQTKGYTMHPSRVSKALKKLMNWTVLQQYGNGYRLNWAAFDQLPPASSKLYPGQPVFEADWLTAQVINQPVARQAFQIMKQGNWPPLLFWDIFKYLEPLTQAQHQHILQAVTKLPSQTQTTDYRHRLAWVDLVNRFKDIFDHIPTN